MSLRENLEGGNKELKRKIKRNVKRELKRELKRGELKRNLKRKTFCCLCLELKIICTCS